jgi:hypothetical protein
MTPRINASHQTIARKELAACISRLNQDDELSVARAIPMVLYCGDRWMTPAQRAKLIDFINLSKQKRDEFVWQGILELDEYNETLRQGLLRFCWQAWMDNSPVRLIEQSEEYSYQAVA